MRIDNLTPSKEILLEIGRRLAKTRKQRKLSQESLAEEAGIGVATLRRIESGRDSQLESWIKILKALGMTNSIDAFMPEQIRSPMDEVKAKSRRSRLSDNNPVWGDEAK